jgi:hypothetical protein
MNDLVEIIAVDYLMDMTVADDFAEKQLWIILWG